MYPTLILSVALTSPAAPLPRDTAPNTGGPAPRVLALKADASGAVRVTGFTPVKVTVTSTYLVLETVVVDGKQVQRQVQKQVEQDVVTTQYMNKALSEFSGKFMTADGAPLTLDEATGRVKNGATVLASADGKPVAKAWLRAVATDTVVMVADGLAHVQPQTGGDAMPTTPAPRLALLGTDGTGKVLTACTSHPISSDNGVNYDNELMFANGGRVIRGRAFRGDVYYGDFNQQTNAKVVQKPLADVKFDAYDRTGKRITHGEAMKRLGAGGMVLVAGDNRMPDETYLQSFRDDVIVLVGSELVLPIPPLDQTKKKEAAKEPMAAPAAPGAVVLPLMPVAPAVKPGVILKALPAAPVAPPAPAPKADVKK